VFDGADPVGSIIASAPHHTLVSSAEDRGEEVFFPRVLPERNLINVYSTATIII
jgi:hypothetical protein